MEGLPPPPGTSARAKPPTNNLATTQVFLEDDEHDGDGSHVRDSRKSVFFEGAGESMEGADDGLGEAVYDHVTGQTIRQRCLHSRKICAEDLAQQRKDGSQHSHRAHSRRSVLSDHRKSEFAQHLRNDIFGGAHCMKDDLYDELGKKTYVTKDNYRRGSCCANVAESHGFQNGVLFVIF